MNKKLLSKIFLCLLIIASLLTFSACSDTQNLKKKSKKITDKSVNAISLKFTGETTTSNGVTVEEIDKATLNKYTKILSNVFSKGSRDPKLFSDSIFENAKATFTPPSKATDEKVDVTLNILKSDVAQENLAVANIVQSKIESGKTMTRSGTIYFNSEGLISGYKLNKFAVGSDS